MDGISQFGGGGDMFLDFARQMQNFKNEQLKISALKMKDEFKNKSRRPSIE